jgi:hypothetical protein
MRIAKCVLVGLAVIGLPVNAPNQVRVIGTAVPPQGTGGQANLALLAPSDLTYLGYAEFPQTGQWSNTLVAPLGGRSL